MTNKQNNNRNDSSDGNNINNPNTKKGKPYHNEYFISIFTISAFLKSFLKEFLDFEVVSVLNWDAMIIEKNTFKDGRSADIVCSVPLISNPAIKVKVVIIIEHKSKYERSIYSQMLKYQTLILDISFRSNSPTPVLVLVFYHGKSPWIWPTSFIEGVWGDLKIPSQFLDNMLDFNMIVVDTNSDSFKKVISNKDLICSGSLNLLSSIWDLKEVKFDDFVDILGKFTEAELDMDEVVSDSISYVESYSRLSESDFVKLWAEVERDLRSKGILKKGGYMNIRERLQEKWIHEGIQKGLMQGKQEGREEGKEERDYEIVLKMLGKGLDAKTISSYTGLSEKDVNNIKFKPKNGSSNRN